MQNAHTLRLGATFLGLAGIALAAVAPTTSDAEAAEAAFARIQALSGRWSVEGEMDDVRRDGQPVDELSTSFRTTAGGSAVLELLFADTDKEMMTVYHLDGDELVLTHYCVVGNAPEMVLQPGEDPDVLEFACRGGANVDCATSMHMHHARYEFAADGRIRTSWDMLADGEVIHTVTSELVRE